MNAEIAIAHRRNGFTLDAAFRFFTPGVTALFGPSGAGKSTLIHAIAGLFRPDEGHIRIDGETLFDSRTGVFVPAPARRLGVVFQDARLFPHLSVKDNLLYGWRRAKDRAEAGEIDRIIQLLGLDRLLARNPRSLSGGEKSRVALGRALLMRPRALLLDEPLAALDAARKSEILPYLENLRDAARLPILYVSHSLDEVARLADRMILIADGRTVAEGSVFELTARLDLTGGRALLPGTVLEGTVSHHDAAYGLSEIAIGEEKLTVPYTGKARGEKVRIRIDPEDVMLALNRPEGVSANNILPVRIAALKRGEDAHCDVQLAFGNARLIARVTRRSAERLALREGMTVFAVIKSVTVGGRG
jgi:molybdate transport system ATP-binding protein